MNAVLTQHHRALKTSDVDVKRLIAGPQPEL